MLLWCTVLVVLNNVMVETAVKGMKLHETGKSYVIDFSEYAKKQGYEGDYSNYTVNKDYCTKDVE